MRSYSTQEVVTFNVYFQTLRTGAMQIDRLLRIADMLPVFRVQLVKATPIIIVKVRVQTAQSEQRSDRSRSPFRRIGSFLHNPVQIADRTYTSVNLTYAYWRRLSEDFTPQRDYLEQLYPHPRDNNCIMVEKRTPTSCTVFYTSTVSQMSGKFSLTISTVRKQHFSF